MLKACICVFLIMLLSACGGSSDSDNSSSSLNSKQPDIVNPELLGVTVFSAEPTTTPSYSFSSTEAGTIAFSGSCSSDSLYVEKGVNSIEFNFLPEGVYDDCSIQVTDDSGNVSKTLAVGSFSIDIANTVTINYDSNADGDVNVITTYTYDANGDELTFTEDTDADGIIDKSRTLAYDANRNIIYKRDSEASTGAIIVSGCFCSPTPVHPLGSIHTYTYNSNNDLLTERVDIDADGVVDTILTYVYDQSDFLLTYSEDNSGDGVPDRATAYIYDATGNMITATTESPATEIFPASVKSITNNTYDPNGNQLTSSIDSNVNGSPNRINTYTYDSRGNRLSYHLDTNGNGDANRIYFYTYDELNHRISSSNDSDADDFPNSIDYNSYTTNGLMLNSSSDTDGDGFLNRSTTITYDSYGNRLTLDFDSNGDGVTDQEKGYTNTYNAKGELLRQEVNIVFNGNISNEKYTYVRIY